MGDLVLKGATSGQITLTPVGTAGTNTLTLPAKTGNIITSADSGTVTQTMLGTNVAGNGPSFRAYGNANQTGLSSTAYTKLQLNVKSAATAWDTASCFDATTNYRFTPTVAGYYLFASAAYLSGSASLTGAQILFYKNGSAVSIPCFSAYTTAQLFVNGSDIIYCNGSTDYIEFYVYASTSSGTYTINANSSATYATAALIRSA